MARRPEELPSRLEPAWPEETFPLTPAGEQAWVDSVACYTSQLSSFWESPPAMAAAIEAHHRQHRGVRLWQITTPPPPVSGGGD